ncbi:hypothetical protein [Aquirhabdus sp.]|uniref:hypothetical protein n=1 Tax=Aquirhabdus sp. TaxID=2824160 RepID=UPI00396C9ED1
MMEIIERLPDFRVTYRFFTTEEGGRNLLPLQGYRSDWIYAEDYYEEGAKSPSSISTFGIHPRFVDENGLIYSAQEIAPRQGFADMFILFNGMRSEHRRRIKIGTKGYFVEGPWLVAEATVIDILYLNHTEHERKIQY